MKLATTPPLSGTTNFDDVIAGLLEIGYEGCFTFEASNTMRGRHAWPHYRRNVKETDRIADPPLFLQKKQISLLYEIGAWMLRSYGIDAE